MRVNIELEIDFYEFQRFYNTLRLTFTPADVVVTILWFLLPGIEIRKGPIAFMEYGYIRIWFLIFCLEIGA